MNIDPATGLDLDDPEVKAMRAAQPAPASPLLAIDVPRGDGRPAGLPDTSGAPPTSTPSIPAPLAPSPQQQGAPPPLPPPSIPNRGASPAAPPAAPGLAPPTMTGGGPSKSVTDRETTSSTTRTVLSKEEKAAQADYQKTLQDQEKVVRDAGQLEQQKALIEQDASAKKDAILARHQEKLKGIVDGANAEYAKAEQRQKDAEAAYRNAKPEGLFADDKYGLRRMAAGIAMMLGGYNAGRNGGPNLGYEMVKDAIDRKDRMERERIGRLKEAAESAKGETAAVLGKKHEALGDLAAWKAGAWDYAAQQLATRLTALGVPQAKVNEDARVLQLRAEAQKERATYLQATRQQITHSVQTKTQQIVGGPGAGKQDKPINEWKPEERKAEGFAMRAFKANEAMDNSAYSARDLEVLRNDALREKAFQGKGLTQAGIEKLMGSTYQRLSPEGKRRFNATKEFVTSVLRPESGAVIGPSEIADAEERYGTKAGDTPEAARQKKGYRMNAIAEVGMQSGRPQFWIDQTGVYGGGQRQGGQPAATAGGGGAGGGLPPGAVSGTLKGVRGYVLNGKFYPLEVAQQ